jgi:hypothetical protein
MGRHEKGPTKKGPTGKRADTRKCLKNYEKTDRKMFNSRKNFSIWLKKADRKTIL